MSNAVASPVPSARQRYLALIRGQTRGVLPSVQRGLLWLASLLYGLGVRLRNALYSRGWLRVHKADVPVVSVGNLTAGGTGKTPCVEFVAGFYRDRELRVAVLSRGYGSAAGPNDEALVLEENLPDVPHLQGSDRVALAATACEELESEILVLDDGFQHRRLARDLDLVLIDATDPWGGGYLLPRGLLREPPSSLARAQAVVLTRCDQVQAVELDALQQRVARLAPGAQLAQAVHEPAELIGAHGDTLTTETLRGREVAAFCGVGNPESFRRTLLGLGARVSAFRVYPDHHPYNLADVEDLRAWGRSFPDGTLIVTTQKDLVKLRIDQLGGRALWALRVRFAFRAGRDALENLLGGLVGLS